MSAFGSCPCDPDGCVLQTLFLMSKTIRTGVCAATAQYNVDVAEARRRQHGQTDDRDDHEHLDQGKAGGTFHQRP